MLYKDEFEALLWNLPEKADENTKSLSKNIQYLGLNSNPGPPAYESGAPSTLSQFRLEYLHAIT
jgi:hypothetical protein